MAPERGPVARGLIRLMVALVVVGLLGAVLFLTADLNRRHYRLNAQAGILMVERGRFLPFGFEPYVADSPALRDAYMPISAPPGTVIPPGDVYDDRSDVDRALFTLISAWAQERLAANDAATLELATTYVKRLEILPGLSEAQRLELRRMRADLAFREGGRLLSDIVTHIKRARAAFEEAIALGSSHSDEAGKMLEQIAQRETGCGTIPPAAAPPAAAAETP